MSDNPRPVLYGSGYEAFLPRRGHGRATDARASRRQALRERRRADLRRRAARRRRRRRPSRHPGHRRLRSLDGEQLQQADPAAGRVRPRRRRRGWSSGARPTRTWSHATSTDRLLPPDRERRPREQAARQAGEAREGGENRGGRGRSRRLRRAGAPRSSSTASAIEYSPSLDGDPDPGEVVWAWVAYEDDPTQGKDRPVVVIGRRGSGLVGDRR